MNAPGVGIVLHPDEQYLALCREIVESDDVGEEGLVRRVVLEVYEEAGIEIAPRDVKRLGAGTFPSPGTIAERYHLFAVEVATPTTLDPPGDGSPMEEGAHLEWLPLADAIASTEDAKTELVLRRLWDDLSNFTNSTA